MKPDIQAAGGRIAMLMLWQAMLLLPRHALGSVPDSGLRPTLVIAGEVTQRKDIWDRRSNPLMGRPDFLKEVDLEVTITRVMTGHVPPGSGSIAVTMTDRSRLRSIRSLAEGWRGIFHLAGDKAPYTLVDFTDGIAPPPKPQVRPAPVAVPPARKQSFPDDLRGRDIRDSRPLQEQAVREIARRYGMVEASFVMMVSHQGPMPPSGGYIYWGVKGKIRGIWHIWQAGGNGRPRPGTELTDPKRHQK